MAVSREEKKRQTRQSLLTAALGLVSSKGNFFSISLREVTRQAGVVPTSFYRHFSDMEELGLSLVDEFGMLMRKVMRSIRKEQLSGKEAQANAISTFVDCIMLNPNLFWFVHQLRASKQHQLRNAIESEIHYFTNELTSEFKKVDSLQDLSDQDLNDLSSLVMGMALNLSLDVLELNPQQDVDKQLLLTKIQKQADFVFVGASISKMQ